MQVTILLEGNNLGEALAQLSLDKPTGGSAAVAPAPATPKKEKVKPEPTQEATTQKASAPEKVAEKKEEKPADPFAKAATGEAIPEQRKALIYKLIDTKEKPFTVALLAEFGVTSGTKLPDDKYPAFFAKATAALAE